MNNKQGISTIVATVLIVLITVAAVTILWAAISPLVGENLEQSTSCLSVQNAVAIDVDAQFTNYDTSGLNDVLRFRVERAANTPELEGFEIFVEDGGTTEYTASYDGTDPAIPEENGAQITTLDGGIIADVDGLTAPTISIAPRVLIDGVATSCTASSPVTLVVN